MRHTSQKECDPHTNESDVGEFESATSIKVQLSSRYLPHNLEGQYNKYSYCENL